MTLSKVLFLSGALAEAETVANNAYEFFKHEAPDPYGFLDRKDSVKQLFQILIRLNKNSTAIGLINSEIKEQMKHLPGTAMSVAVLDWCVMDYYVDHAQPKQAAIYVRYIKEIKNKCFHGNDRIQFNMVLVQYALNLKDDRLVTESVVDALPYLKTSIIKQESVTVRQEWMYGFSTALNILRKSAASQVYAQTLALIQEGFTQQLNSNADLAVLAHVVNNLSNSGEKGVAERLRSQAAEKLPPKKATVSLSHCMDFVAGYGNH